MRIRSLLAESREELTFSDIDHHHSPIYRLSTNSIAETRKAIPHVGTTRGIIVHVFIKLMGLSARIEYYH